MAMEYGLHLYTPAGLYRGELAFKSVDVTLTERSEMIMTAVLFPYYSDALFARHSRVAFYRAPYGIRAGGAETLVGNTVWLVEGRERYINDAGQHSIVLTCAHPNEIFGYRLVAYPEKNVKADKSDLISEVLYDYVDENFVTATDTARNLSSAHFVLDPRPAPAFGPTVDYAGSYQNILDIIHSLTQSAAAQGEYVGYEIYVPVVPGPFHARFYHNVRGVNRGFGTANFVGLNPSSANMTSVSAREDWSSAVSFVYAGGSGKQDERHIRTASDATLIAQSPFGRIERFESFDTDVDAVLDTDAQKVLRDYRPHRMYESDIKQWPEEGGYAYGIDYGWGDIVGVQFAAPIYEYAGQVGNWQEYQFNCRVNPVKITVSREFGDDGEPRQTYYEQLEIHLQSVDNA